VAGIRELVTRLTVFRWAPGEAERTQTYDVQAGPDTTVLDALVAIQREQDPTLALRYACRVGMCGSCAMVVNGRERWACRTRLASLGEGRHIDDAIECIGCGMCLSACTMVAHDARFAGPAALNRAFTLQRDRRDAAHEARWAVLLGDDALPRCHGQGGCTDVCPMGLSPTRSIIRLRQMAVRRLVAGAHRRPARA